MKPILFYIGGLPVYSFGTMVAAGVFFSLILMARPARRAGLKSEDPFDLVFTTVFTGFFGARLLYVLQNFHEYAADPWRAFAVWEGGLIFYGGVAGAYVGVFMFTKIRKIPFWKALDFLMPFV